MNPTGTAANVPEVPPVLRHLVDTFLPATSGSSAGPPYPSGSEAGADRAILDGVASLPRGAQREFAQLLGALDNRFVNLLLTGRPVRFSALNGAARERYLLGWATSALGVKRRGFQSAKRLAAWAYFTGPVGSAIAHPLWQRIHYAPTPPSSGVPDPFVGLNANPPAAEGTESTEVVVVGSGAGGSLVAWRLASAGYRVTVLEAGAWVAGLAYPRGEREAFDRLFFERGLATTSDRAISLLAGEGPGGSTTVNWMTCLPPRPEARTEWATGAGLEGVDGPSFDRIYEEIVGRLSVSTSDSDVNPSNDMLRRGSIRLGYREGPDWGIIPRNAAGCASRCGPCTFGCVYGGRRSPATVFLAEAMRAGARLYCHTRAESVETSGGRVQAVRAHVEVDGRSYPIELRAPTVVLAAGALQTPALLLRSHVGPPGTGLGLRLDPTTAFAAESPGPVRTWEGPHQTVGVYKFQASSPGAHGPWIEAAPAHPGLAAIGTPWTGARTFLERLERSERNAVLIVLVRDVAEGRIRVDAQGRPEVDYRLSGVDRANLTRGLIEGGRIAVAAGATRLTSLHTPPVEAGGGAEPMSAAQFETYAEGVRGAGIRENSVALFSAHPMGSARAGPDPRRSTARPSGEVHGVDGLWIGDGSLLPTAPGANPMMSILALAWRTSDHILAGLAGRRPSPPPAG
ncbi:MAG: GMC family oxidoreductase N-terminal domain-containing protein [Thermoplasmata archaeon]